MVSGLNDFPSWPKFLFPLQTHFGTLSLGRILLGTFGPTFLGLNFGGANLFFGPNIFGTF